MHNFLFKIFEKKEELNLKYDQKEEINGNVIWSICITKDSSLPELETSLDTLESRHLLIMERINRETQRREYCMHGSLNYTY